MSRPPLPKDLLEPEMTETVEVTELYGATPGGIFDFIGCDFTQKTIETSWGDLRIIVDALMDYASILECVVDEWNLINEGIYYKCHAARCRGIAHKYAQAIDYDREAALGKCRKKREESDDVGEDAMALMVKRGSTKGAKPKAPDLPDPKGGAEQLPPRESGAAQLSLF